MDKPFSVQYIMPIAVGIEIGRTTSFETDITHFAGGVPGEPARVPLVGGAGYPLGAEAPREKM
jgi:hypothetical protein